MTSKELLGEYSKLSSKIEHINETLQEMNAVDIAQLIDKMRIVERKMGVVYTLFKSSVYAVTQQMREQEEELEQEQEQERAQEQEAEHQHEQFRNSLQYNQDQSRRRSIQSQGQGQSQSEDEQDEKEQYQQYSEQEYQQQQQQQQLQNRRLTQPQSYNQSRRSLYPSSEESHNTVNNALRSSQSRNSVVTPSTRSQSVLRVSNANAAREEFQSGMNNNRSVLSVSRGYGSSRWSQGAMVRDSDNQTNRPRYY